MFHVLDLSRLGPTVPRCLPGEVEPGTTVRALEVSACGGQGRKWCPRWYDDLRRAFRLLVPAQVQDPGVSPKPPGLSPA